MLSCTWKLVTRLSSSSSDIVPVVGRSRLKCGNGRLCHNSVVIKQVWVIIENILGSFLASLLGQCEVPLGVVLVRYQPGVVMISVVGGSVVLPHSTSQGFQQVCGTS